MKHCVAEVAGTFAASTRSVETLGEFRYHKVPLPHKRWENYFPTLAYEFLLLPENVQHKTFNRHALALGIFSDRLFVVFDIGLGQQGFPSDELL